MGKKEDNKKKKREALLTSAYLLFTEKGIQRTTISDIVKHASIAKGTFYLYFKDKYEIRDKLIAIRGARIIEKSCLALLDEEEMSFEDAIIFLADRVIDLFEQNKASLSFISKNLSVALFNRSNTEEEKNRCVELFNKIIERSGKTFRDENIMFYMVIELVNSTCYDCIINKAPVSMEMMRPELYKAIKSLLVQLESE